MKKPMYALLISPDDAMRANILSGKKRITIREGHRDYRNGSVMLCCHIEPWVVLAEITQVRHCILKEVTYEELVADGFKDHNDLLKGLRKYYPNLSLDSAVTVIKWDNVKGKLVSRD